MAKGDWRKDPKIQAAKAVNNKFGYDGVIIIAKHKDGVWDGFSYGPNKAKCDKLGELMEELLEQAAQKE